MRKKLLAIGVCKDQCKCPKYLSMNSDEGQKMEEKWGSIVDKILEPLAVVFAKEEGFYKEVVIEEGSNG